MRLSCLVASFALAACSGAPIAVPSGASTADASDAASDRTGATEASDAIETGSGGGADRGLDDAAASATDFGTDAASATTGSARLIAEATRELGAMTSSTYSHTTLVDESTGTFDYDCSGFIDYALSIADPAALATLEGATVGRPLAKHFETFFASLSTTSATGGWQGVSRVDALVAGDVIAWLVAPGSTSTDTGHTLIVREIPTPRAGYDGEFVVPIVDSTSTPHGTSDSRTPSGATGLGTGSIVLVADASGAPIAHRWSTTGSKAPVVTPIALGHQP